MVAMIYDSMPYYLETRTANETRASPKARNQRDTSVSTTHSKSWDDRKWFLFNQFFILCLLYF